MPRDMLGFFSVVGFGVFLDFGDGLEFAPGIALAVISRFLFPLGPFIPRDELLLHGKRLLIVGIDRVGTVVSALKTPEQFGV